MGKSIQFFARLLFLLLFVAGSQILLFHYNKAGYGELISLDKSIRAKKQIIYFESSVNAHTKHSDTDRRPISGMLQGKLLNWKIGRADHPSYNLRMFAPLVRHIINSYPHPKILIVPLSLESFSPGFDLRPNYQFAKEQTILKGGWEAWFYTPLSIFKYFPADTFMANQRWINSPVYDSTSLIGYYGPYYYYNDSAKLERAFMAYYMETILSSHPKLTLLRNMIAEIKKTDIKILLYINPVDYESGEKFHPGEFKKQIARNAGIIKSILDSAGMPYLDLSMAIPHINFDYHEPCEHLDQTGKMYIATKVYGALKKIYPGIDL